LAILETSKLFIIPLVNHQNQPLDKNFASFSTLRNEVSYSSIRERDLKPIFHNFLKPESQNKPHYLYALLHILPSLHHNISVERTSLGNSLATQSSCIQQQHTHIKQKKTTQRFQCYQTPLHFNSVILLVFTPLRANIPNYQQKKMLP
jgi:hypothetical protein